MLCCSRCLSWAFSRSICLIAFRLSMLMPRSIASASYRLSSSPTTFAIPSMSLGSMSYFWPSISMIGVILPSFSSFSALALKRWRMTFCTYSPNSALYSPSINSWKVGFFPASPVVFAASAAPVASGLGALTSGCLPYFTVASGFSLRFFALFTPASGAVTPAASPAPAAAPPSPPAAPPWNPKDSGGLVALAAGSSATASSHTYWPY